MVRASSSKKGGDKDDPESKQRKRLKSLALDNKLLSDSPSRCLSSLKPSKQVLKHHGCDIIRKSQRKNRFLFSFPGLLAPVSGATIGDLDRLSTKNPVLYLNFPQVRSDLPLVSSILEALPLILLGVGSFRVEWSFLERFCIRRTDTWLFNSLEVAKTSCAMTTLITWSLSYPSLSSLSMYIFESWAFGLICTQIVFSESWWIGTKEENPEESRLDFPKELSPQVQLHFS